MFQIKCELQSIIHKQGKTGDSQFVIGIKPLDEPSNPTIEIYVTGTQVKEFHAGQTVLVTVGDGA